MVLRLGTVVLVARLLGPSALGELVLTLTLTGGAVLTATVGLDRATMRFVAHHRGRDEPSEAAAIFRFSSVTSACAGAALGAVGFLGAPAVAHWLHRPELVTSTRIMVLAVPLLALGQVSRGALCGFQDVRLAMILEHVATPAATVLLIVAIHFWRPADSTAPVLAVAVAQGAFGVIAWLAARNRFSRERGRTPYRPHEWMRFSVPVWLEQWMFFLVVGSGYAFVARFDDLQSVGVYASAVRVAALVGFPLAAVSAILGSTISNLAGRGEWEHLRELYWRVTKVLAVVGIVAALGLEVAGRLLLSSFGPEFRAASGALAVLLVGQVVNAATGPSGLLLTMTGRTVRRLGNVTAGAAIAVGLSFLLVPRWGSVGAAAAGVVASSLVNGVQMLQVRRLLDLGALKPEAPAPADPVQGEVGMGARR